MRLFLIGFCAGALIGLVVLLWWYWQDRTEHRQGR